MKTKYTCRQMKDRLRNLEIQLAIEQKKAKSIKKENITIIQSITEDALYRHFPEMDGNVLIVISLCSTTCKKQDNCLLSTCDKYLNSDALNVAKHLQKYINMLRGENE